MSDDNLAVYVQEWEESERGWGTRPDGYSFHFTQNDVDTFIRAYWAEETARNPTNTVPDEYSRPLGRPKLVLVTEAFYEQVKSLRSVRVYRNSIKDLLA